MLKTFLELIIAVTFVYAVEGLVTMVTAESPSSKVPLELHFGGSIDTEACALYVFPVVMLALHTVSLAHYHQKQENWGIVEIVAAKINGLWEIAQYMALAGSIVMLILATRFLPESQHRHRIVLFWGAAYLFYSLGDFLTRGLTKEEDVPGAFHPLRKAMPYTDLVAALLAVVFCALTCRWRVMDEKQSVMWFGLVVLGTTLLNYWIGWKFMTYERPSSNTAEKCPLFGMDLKRVKELCPFNSIAPN